jgi:hypothetical protein
MKVHIKNVSNGKNMTCLPEGHSGGQRFSELSGSPTLYEMTARENPN